MMGDSASELVPPWAAFGLLLHWFIIFVLSVVCCVVVRFSLGKIVKIYTQLKSGFLFATPLILASCWSHLRVCTGNLHTYGFLPLKYTRFWFCLSVYHTAADLSIGLSHIGCSYISVSHIRENTMQIYTPSDFGHRNITPSFCHASCSWVFFLANNLIFPYHQVLVKHTHPQLTYNSFITHSPLRHQPQ